jgi:hypothetical protein
MRDASAPQFSTRHRRTRPAALVAGLIAVVGTGALVAAGLRDDEDARPRYAVVVPASADGLGPSSVEPGQRLVWHPIPGIGEPIAVVGLRPSAMGVTDLVTTCVATSARGS